MKILVYQLTFRESPLHLYYHDNHTGYTTETTTSWLQTNQNSTSDYNTQFSNQFDRSKMLKVVHGNQSDNHCIRSDTQPSIPQLSLSIYIIQYHSSTRKYPKFSLLCLACTNITPTLLSCCAIKLLLLLLKTGQTKSHLTLTVWPIADFLPVLYICCCCCWSLLYADLNRYNTRHYR